MRRWPVSVVGLALVALFGVAWPAVAGEPKHVVLDVPGMNCALCPLTVRTALERVPGVIAARVTYEPKRAEVTYDPDKVSPDALAKAVTEAGYPATVKRP